MASAIARQLIHPQKNSTTQHVTAKPLSSSLACTTLNGNRSESPRMCSLVLSHRNSMLLVKSSSEKGSAVSVDDEEGVSLGTMKLSPNTDIPRFETLLFQWANSLCQGAQMPLPLPMKVDKIKGGVRLGFVNIDDGKADVFAYIDCQVIPGNNGSSEPPMFRATRKGTKKDKVPPGEPRIMKSLLAALRKSAEIARL